MVFSVGKRAVISFQIEVPPIPESKRPIEK
jgi:hypothetical protein